METIEDILAEMQGIIDGAAGRSLTDDEVSRYEQAEARLATARKSEELRARNAAYNAVSPAVHVGVPKPDDGLDKAFEAYLRTGQPNADITGLRVTNEQGVGTSAGGGYTVPDGFRQKLVEVRKAFGGFAAVADSFSTGNGQPIDYPSLDDTSNSGDITAENAQIADGDDLAFGSVKLGAYKYTAAGAGTGLPLRVPVELLQDSAFDIAGLVARVLGTRIARKQAVHWVTGTGVGQPLGIVASSLTDDDALTTDDTITYEDLVDFQDALDEEYDPFARWLMRKSTWSAIRKVEDGNQRPIIQNSLEGISGRPERLLLGKPVTIDEAVPAISTTADTYIMAYGDFREAYVIRRVQSLVVVVNPYSRANFGQVEYSAWERADGNVQNRSAYKILANDSA